MAHKVETMAYAGDVPWHGLGTKVDSNISVDEMVKAAGIDWKVNLEPIQVNGTTLQGKRALCRDDGTFYDFVSDKWNPCNNRDAFEVFEPFVKAGELELDTAGSLKDGRIVWGLAKMKERFDLFKEDTTENYLLLVNPHQWGKKIHVRSTPIRVVCNNTLSLSLGQLSSNEVSQSHKNVFDVQMMWDALGIAKEKFNTYKQVAEFISNVEYSDKKVQEYFAKCFPGYSKSKDESVISRNAEQAMDVLRRQPGNEYGKNTWWQAFNAVTYMSDHMVGKTDDSRMYSAWFGSNMSRKNKALELAVEYAEAA